MNTAYRVNKDKKQFTKQTHLQKNKYISPLLLIWNRWLRFIEIDSISEIFVMADQANRKKIGQTNEYNLYMLKKAKSSERGREGESKQKS